MKAKSKTNAPDPTIAVVMERLVPLIDAYLQREAARSSMHDEIFSRELAMRGRELDLQIKEHELRIAEQEVDHAERRARLAARCAAGEAEVTRD